MDRLNQRYWEAMPGSVKARSVAQRGTNPNWASGVFCSVALVDPAEIECVGHQTKLALCLLLGSSDDSYLDPTPLAVVASGMASAKRSTGSII